MLTFLTHSKYNLKVMYFLTILNLTIRKLSNSFILCNKKQESSLNHKICNSMLMYRVLKKLRILRFLNGNNVHISSMSIIKKSIHILFS